MSLEDDARILPATGCRRCRAPVGPLALRRRFSSGLPLIESFPFKQLYYSNTRNPCQWRKVRHLTNTFGYPSVLPESGRQSVRSGRKCRIMPGGRFRQTGRRTAGRTSADAPDRRAPSRTCRIGRAARPRASSRRTRSRSGPCSPRLKSRSSRRPRASSRRTPGRICR